MIFFRRSSLGFFVVVLLVGTRGTLEPAPPGALAGRAVYVADSTDDRVLILVDRDGSGSVELEEVVVFYDDSSPGPDLSVPSALLWSPSEELLLLDGGTLDVVLVLADKNGDGNANGEGEWRVFYDDSSPGPNLATPGAMALHPDGALYIADDGARAQRILRVQDLDGNGDANGAGEWVVVYDKDALSPLAGAFLDPEALAFLPDGRLLVADSTLGQVLVMADTNADGDFLSPGEVSVFYDSLGTHSFGNLKGLAVSPTGEVFVGDAGSGLVVRLGDRNGDGDALDGGEATFYLDPALPPNLLQVGDLVVAPGSALVVLDKIRDTVYLASDLDGDGRAAGEGEARSWVLDQGVSLTTPVAVAIGPATELAAVFVTGVTPPVGATAGGTEAQISGRFGSSDTAVVTFGGAAAVILSASSSRIDCLTPPGDEGAVDVQVTTAEGEATLAGGFEYRNELFIRGNANSNGGVDLADGVAILAFLFLGGLAPPCRDTLDVNDNGTVELDDPLYLLNFLFVGGVIIPSPYPLPGIDSTPDGLSCFGN